MKKILLLSVIVLCGVLAHAKVDYSFTAQELRPFALEWNKMYHNISYNNPEKTDHRMALYFQTFVRDVMLEAVKRKKVNIPEDITMNRIFEIAWETLNDKIYDQEKKHESAAKLIIQALEKKYPKKWWGS